MLIRVCFFSDYGRELANKIEQECKGLQFERKEKERSLEEWTKECFQKRLPILFIGACGIAVRTIAPFVEDKRYDSPVLVMDDRGRYVIPILSGHLGGANELAKMLEMRCGCIAVITTATDIHEQFSIDLFAKDNGLLIIEKEGIVKVSSKLLKGENVTIAIDPNILHEGELPRQLKLVEFHLEENQSADIMIVTAEIYQNHNALHGKDITLVTKDYVLGVGCKKGKTFEELLDFIKSVCPIDWECRLNKITSIDLKRDEIGLIELAQYEKVPFVTYSSSDLMEIEGDFSTSAFVKDVTGVDCVSERAAVYGAGKELNCLLMKKIAKDGMTLALAKTKRSHITFYGE